MIDCVRVGGVFIDCGISTTITFVILIVFCMLFGLALVLEARRDLKLSFRLEQTVETPLGELGHDENVKVSGTVREHPEHGFVSGSVFVEDDEWVFVDWELLYRGDGSWSSVDSGIDSVPIMLEGENGEMVEVEWTLIDHVLLKSFDESVSYYDREKAPDGIQRILRKRRVDESSSGLHVGKLGVVSDVQVRRDCLKPGDEVTLIAGVKNDSEDSEPLIRATVTPDVPFTVTNLSRKQLRAIDVLHVGKFLWGLSALVMGVWALVNTFVMELHPEYLGYSIVAWIGIAMVYAFVKNATLWVHSKRSGTFKS